MYTQGVRTTRITPWYSLTKEINKWSQNKTTPICSTNKLLSLNIVLRRLIYSAYILNGSCVQNNSWQITFKSVTCARAGKIGQNGSLAVRKSESFQKYTHVNINWKQLLNCIDKPKSPKYLHSIFTRIEIKRSTADMDTILCIIIPDRIHPLVERDDVKYPHVGLFLPHSAHAHIGINQVKCYEWSKFCCWIIFMVRENIK